MKTNYTIKNFRVFDKKGVTVEISPMTFLVGCNSSGKSSIVKSLTLLKSFFGHKIDKDHPVIGTTIDFSEKPNDTLGSFSNVVNSTSREKVVKLGYVAHSDYINDDVKVTLTLTKGELGNAVVTGVQIEKNDGTILVGKTNNFLSLKNSFRQYLLASRLRSKLRSISPEPGVFFTEEKKKKAAEAKTLKEYALFAQRHCDKHYLLAIFANRIKSCILDDKAQPALDKFAETGIITYYSILDDLKGLSDPEAVRCYLKSRIKDCEIKDALTKAVDLICDDLVEKGETEFLHYYRDLEDSSLYSFDVELIESSAEYALWWNTMDSVHSLAMKNGSSPKEIKVSYDFVHDTLAHLSDNDQYASVYVSSSGSSFPEANKTLHPLYSTVFHEYINNFLSEILTNDITEGIDYISSSRIQVRRLYPLEDKNEFSDAVKRYFEAKTRYMTLEGVNIIIDDENSKTVFDAFDFMPGKFMNKWLRIFGIGDHISLEMDKNGLGLLLKLYRDENDRKGILVADVGYGITQLFSILLQIEEMIMSSIYGGYRLSYIPKRPGEIQRGFTVRSQYNRILKPRTVAIEEPEIHLHPKYQSLLAEMFYEAYKEYNIQFIIETHSEYLLRKIQNFVGAKQLKPNEVSVVYVEDNAEVVKGNPKIRRIRIKDDGCLAEPFSPGFYDEADSLAMALLRLKFGQ